MLTKIHDKLITDFATLQFEGAGVLFNNVKKYFADNTMGASDCLLTLDSVAESTSGGSAGNSATTREATFLAVFFETLEKASSDTEASTKYSRLLNITTSILDYLQKEPNNLRLWGAGENIQIHKIRAGQTNYQAELTPNGYAIVAYAPFTVYINITPQLL